MQKRKNKKEIITFLLALVVIFPGMYSIKLSKQYAFVNTVPFPLWYVALGIGILAGVLYALLDKSKKSGNGIRILKFIFVVFFSFWVTGSVFANLNHVLDSAETEQYTVRIEDKDSTGSKHRLYEFTVTVDGKKFDINVPRKQYYSLDEGDLYVIEYHKGAFNEPYYIGIGGLE